MTGPVLIRFDTQEQLEEYVEILNEEGVEPSVALIDSAGTQTMAHRTAPGGDGYGFEYAIHDREPETGGVHCCECSVCPRPRCDIVNGPDRTSWVPEFPVWVMEHTR